jgi:hypothetical protein
MESICDYDDTLPSPDEVEREFINKAGDDLTALAWLQERDIDPAPILTNVGKIALIQYWSIWDPETGRYRFMIYAPDHVGPKYPPELAIPIIETGNFVDLLFISDQMSYTRTTCRTPWLGRENLTLPVVRLHPHPMDWLEAGCEGVCHIEPISRRALAELTDATTIECNDVHTALEAWSIAMQKARRFMGVAGISRKSRQQCGSTAAGGRFLAMPMKSANQMNDARLLPG